MNNLLVKNIEYSAIKNYDKSEIVFLDVRTPGENKLGTLDGSVNVDFFSDNFLSQMKQFNPEDTYIVFCRSGVRSLNACKLLINELGFKNVMNLTGGYNSVM